MKRVLAAATISAVALLGAPGGTAGAESDGPTCSNLLPIEVHGQHVVGDYVAGVGHDDLGWPPPSGAVGKAVAANGGAKVPGGPGPGYHFVEGYAPGASFCNDSQSPGLHP